jgi:hypothetical protein
MKRGYVGTIGNEFVFVVATKIALAKEKFEKQADGKAWEFDSTRNYKIIE